jgi:hypothetical protein
MDMSLIEILSPLLTKSSSYQGIALYLCEALCGTFREEHKIQKNDDKALAKVPRSIRNK